jgi:hypothetical protein
VSVLDGEIDPVFDHEPTDEVWAEIQLVRDAQTARDFLDQSATLRLPALVEHQAVFFRYWPSAAGEMVARHMEELALRIRWVKAETPADYEARAEIVERDARETWRQAGYEDGLAAGRREAMPYGGPLD